MTYHQEHLFDMDPEPSKLRPVAEMRRMHGRGLILLDESLPDPIPTGAIVRVRDAADVRLDPRRGTEVTIRYKTASGQPAAEWRALNMGDVPEVIVAWLDVDLDALVGWMILEPEPLVAAITTRSGCLVPNRTTRRLLWHAPGGAEFLVANVRFMPPEVVRVSSEPIYHDPAPVTIQGRLF